MKKLTIEQKAKAYDKIIERAKEKYAMFEGMKQGDVLEDIFPELAESEEERIREWLIALIKSNEYGSISNVGKMPCPKLKVLDWLEKQGEQKPAEWSEEDKELCEHLIKSIEESEPLPTSIYFDCKRWLESLKDRIQHQYAWKPSDEQLNSLYDVLNPCDGFNRKVLVSLYNDLKKLKE